jgi:hypothetical protein
MHQHLKQMQIAWQTCNTDFPDYLAPSSDHGNHGKDSDNPSWLGPAT